MSTPNAADIKIRIYWGPLVGVTAQFRVEGGSSSSITKQSQEWSLIGELRCGCARLEVGTGSRMERSNEGR